MAALTAVACGENGTTTASEEPAEPDRRYTATAMVLESPDHGPQLCLGGVNDSLPPQCGGPDIVGWSWEDVDEYETASGTTWGSYTVVGTYDGDAFTLTEPPRPPEQPEDPGDTGPRLQTPCEEPPGGWQVVDQATATSEAMQEAIAYAAEQPDHAGTWLDQSINPALDEDADVAPEDREMLANDPTKLVLNFRFTGDLQRHEDEIRAIWGGALCVSAAEHTEAELRDIQRELSQEYSDRLLASSADTVTGHVDLRVILDDGSLQRELDERYGEGLVRVRSALQPAD
ncbi:MAG: hypothetical protein ACODAF_05695 [Actinomycetota bacterium]